MDGQHSEKPHSHTTADRTSSTTSQNSRSVRRQAGTCGNPEGDTRCPASHRFSSHVSRSTKDLSCMKVPQDPAHRDRQAHPTTILLCKSQSSQAALVPREHKMFMEEAYNAAICFKMLRDLNSSDPLHLKYIIKKIKNMAYGTPNLVLETIHDYFVDNPKISSRHRFRLFHVLEAVIEASDSLEEAWEKSFMQLALENMTKSTELEEAYQDAASNVLLAICRHSWRVVAQHLETEVLTGVFPHRSLLYVMGILTSNEAVFNQGEKACWEEQLAQMAVKSVQFLNTDVWSKELLLALTKPDQTHQEQPPEKAFLFIYYGLILQAEDNSTTVRTHVRTLLDTSHQWPKQREGIALTIGLAAVRHLDHVWAVLEQFGRSTPIKWSLHSFCLKNSEDLQWKWASSTILLAYGQMAVRAKAHILPWVDNILSRMVFYFHYSSWDETLKQSFLTAVLMLVGAISRKEGAHSYEFSQISELLECLMVLMEKEPQDTLCTSTRQQTIHIVSSLCKLRPPLDLERKSRILSVCLHSVLALPLLDVLEKHTCLFLEPPNIQTLYNKTSEALDQMLQSFIMQNPTADELHFLLSHLYLWLKSEKAHERQRAVHSCMALLRFLSHNPYLDVASLGRAIHLQLCSVRIPQAKENALHAITLLARNHTPELVATFLDFSIPLDSHAFRLWRALGAEQPVSRLVLAMLLAWLQERPLPAGTRDGSRQPKDKPRLRSLAAMNTLHELQFAREFKKAVQEAYPELLLALLTQMHYILELNLPDEPQPGQKAPEAAMSSLQSMSLEALKSLLSTTGHWQDFAHLELQGAWKLFTTTHTYPQGVGLLARAMVQNHCKQIQAVTSLLLPRLQSKEERERKAAILILTEFLYSPALLEVLPRQAALTALARSLRDPSPEVRVLSLQGLGNILFHPEKGSLLRRQLPPFLDGFFHNSEQVVMQVMGTVSDVLHRLGAHSAAAQSLRVAINARSFFDDVTGWDPSGGHGIVRGPGGSHGGQGAKGPADPGTPEHGAPAPAPEGLLSGRRHAGQVCPVPLRRAAPVATSAHPVLHAGLGEGPQCPPLPLDLPDDPQPGGVWHPLGAGPQLPAQPPPPHQDLGSALHRLHHLLPPPGRVPDGEQCRHKPAVLYFRRPQKRPRARPPGICQQTVLLPPEGGSQAAVTSSRPPSPPSPSPVPTELVSPTLST
ncbi:maestro heat-like repeat family member 5 isoform X11 [Callorhinus ursinus]|uniref:maestro heat-like repeat family member 5 isoform X11 n=1 Tax=Callorhinus ursinus TaxID=34884 RepID=UPI003CD046A0